MSERESKVTGGLELKVNFGAKYQNVKVIGILENNVGASDKEIKAAGKTLAKQFQEANEQIKRLLAANDIEYPSGGEEEEGSPVDTPKEEPELTRDEIEEMKSKELKKHCKANGIKTKDKDLEELRDELADALGIEDDDDDDKGDGDTIECKACSGDGTSSKGKDCKPCKGTGRLPKPDDEDEAEEGSSDDDDDDDEGPTLEEVKKMKKPELVKIAKAEDIEDYKDMTSKELKAAIIDELDLDEDDDDDDDDEDEEEKPKGKGKGKKKDEEDDDDEDDDDDSDDDDDDDLEEELKELDMPALRKRAKKNGIKVKEKKRAKLIKEIIAAEEDTDDDDDDDGDEFVDV